MHHGHLAFAVEQLILGVLRIKLRSPVGLEVDSVQQIGYCRRFNLGDDVFYHTVGLVVAPIVDNVGRFLCLCKVQRLGLSIVIVGDILLELLFQLVFLVQKNGVSDVKRYLVINLWQIIDKILAVVVHGLDASLVET